MRAFCAIREQPYYRRSAFVSGLKAAGHTVVSNWPTRLGEDFLFVLWNRYGTGHEQAKCVEATGGKVIVAENGYVGEGGGTPKFQVHPEGPQPHHYYSLACSHHNGGGDWRVGGAERLQNLKLHVKPWRQDGDYILVCPNRSFGVPERMMHPDWAERCAAKLKRKTDMPVRIRMHPGNSDPRVPLEADLRGAACVVIWSSSVGVHALIEGIPVVCEAPYWICKSASSDGLDLNRNDEAREQALQAMSWAQWRCEEIERGEPFRHLLPAAG